MAFTVNHSVPFQQAHHPSALQQTWTLTVRTLLDSTRNISVFWMRLGMYIMLCLALYVC